MVLTGGASQLTGLAEAARRMLARNVRLGPAARRSPACRRSPSGPAFATAVGLLIYPQVGGMERSTRRRAPRLAMTGTGGYFARVGQWIRESF